MIRYFHLGSKNRGQLRFLKRSLRPIQQYNKGNRPGSGLRFCDSSFAPSVQAGHQVSSLGESIKDDESIVAANENVIAMAFTGIRHFKH